MLSYFQAGIWNDVGGGKREIVASCATFINVICTLSLKYSPLKPRISFPFNKDELYLSQNSAFTYLLYMYILAGKMSEKFGQKWTILVAVVWGMMYIHKHNVCMHVHVKNFTVDQPEWQAFIYINLNAFPVRRRFVVL